MDRVPPDAVALVGDFLRPVYELVVLRGDRVGTRLVAPYPAQRLSVVDGFQQQTWEWEVRVRVESWAEDEDTAIDMAHVSLAAFNNSFAGTHPLGVVGSVDASFPYASNDPGSGKYRYVSDVTFLLFNLPDVQPF